MFLGRPSVRASVRASVRDSRGSFMFPRYLQCLLTDFRQTFVTGASQKFLGAKNWKIAISAYSSELITPERK